MAKVYTILREQGAAIPTIFVPIKATLNPHTRGPAFCADLPNFFGGTMVGDNPVQTLTNELSQESQNKLIFNPTLTWEAFGEPDAYIQDGYANNHGYDFYVLNGSTVLGVNWEPSHVANVGIIWLESYSVRSISADYHEHQCILRIPNTKFARQNGLYTNDVYGLIHLCIDAVNGAIPGLRDVIRDERDTLPNFQQFENSQTKLAFNTFLSRF